MFLHFVLLTLLENSFENKPTCALAVGLLQHRPTHLQPDSPLVWLYSFIPAENLHL